MEKKPFIISEQMYEEIKTQTDRLLAKFKNSNILPNVPTEVLDKMVIEEGLSIKKIVLDDNDKDFEAFCGFVDLKEKAIYLNASLPHTWQNVTKAHELGHWILHRQGYIDNKIQEHVFKWNEYTDSMSEAEKVPEKEANFFAARLLLPAKMLMEEKRKIETIVNTTNIEADKFSADDFLADLFQVPLLFMKHRIKNIMHHGIENA
jgi:Zn-dependent peptidase ImmA (M78 family)